MSKQIRLCLASYTIAPQAMLDDGDQLTSLQVAAMTVSPADWPQLLTIIADAVEQLRRQVEPPAELGKEFNEA